MTRRFFSDLDELASALPNCEAHLFATGAAKRPSSLALIQLGDVQMLSAHLTSPMMSVATLRDDLVQFSFPLMSRGGGWTVQGQPFGIHDVSIIAPGVTHVARADAPRRVICVTVPVGRFLERFNVLHPEGNAAIATGVHTPPPCVLNAAHQALAVVYRFAYRFPDLASKVSVNNVVLGPLLDRLIRLMEPADVAGHASASTRVLSDVEQFVRAHENEPVTVLDLCRVAHASERTIRNVFHKMYGTTPTTYLRMRGLTQAHRDLRDADPRLVHVTDVAMRYGFLDIGRFAARYRHMFGEYPSETLRRS